LIHFYKRNKDKGLKVVVEFQPLNMPGA